MTRPARRQRAARTLLAAIASLPLLVVALTGCGSHAGPAGTGGPALVGGSPRPGPESIFEPKGPLFADPARTLDLMRRLGVDRVKVFVAWNTLAPDPLSRRRPLRFNAGNPASYPAGVWAPYDGIVRDAAERGIGVYLAVGGLAPLWATGSNPAPGGPYRGAQWKPSPAQFGQFLHAVATRYSGTYKPPGGSAALPRVSFWSIWNEPNLGSADLAPQAIDHSRIEASPALYRTLVDAGWSALRATGHGGDTILIGEIAPYGQTGGDSPGNYGEMVPLRFVRALYCVDGSLRALRGAAASKRGCPVTAAGSGRFALAHPGLFRATGFAVHPYPSGAVAPDVVLTGGPDFVNMATVPKLEHVLDTVTSAYGTARRYPIYVTEYGYFTNPPYAAGAPLALAAGYINWAEYMAWRDPRIRSVDQFLLQDPPPGSASKFVTGLEFANGTRKPTFAAYRLPIYMPDTRAAGQAVEVWGCLRPARYLPRQVRQMQHVRIELKSRSGGGFSTIRIVTVTNPHGYFDVAVRFPAAGAVRLAWSDPHGPEIYSRLVSITHS